MHDPEPSDHTSPASELRYHWESPPTGGRAAAIGIVHLIGDPSQIFSRLSLRPIEPGGAALRNIGGIDTAVVACIAPAGASSDGDTPEIDPKYGSVLITPHAGVEVRRSLSAWLESLGLRPAIHGPRLSHPSASTTATYPPFHAVDEYSEAGSEIEAMMLRTLASAVSPLAIDLLLDQPRRWKAIGVRSCADAERLPPDAFAAAATRSAPLNHLLRPPLVATAGPPNIGKSTLLNTLARRPVSLVADEPGTTRDHVGVLIDMAGLVVRFVDTPGLTLAVSDPVQRAAQSLARDVISHADLVLLCQDAATSTAFGTPTGVSTARRARRVLLRSDLGLGAIPKQPQPDICVSSHTGEGIERLVQCVRDALVPPAALMDPGPWIFWNRT